MNSRSSSAQSGSHAAAHGAVLTAAAVVAAAVLIVTGQNQLFDTNFQTLWEATELLAGDHPYRDFFEWGLPLQASVSVAAQILTGHRLVGEFLVHWIFIVAGIVLSLHLAIRLSGSIAASVAAMSLAVMLLAATPTYHYPKLFFYPLALWQSWRYIEAPTVRRAILLGLTTAVAFLFRHDHGIYIGVLAVVTFVLARAMVPSSRAVRAMVAESAAYTAAATAVLLPWLTVVHLTEGVPEYVRARTYLYQDWAASDSPYLSLLTMNPIQTLIGDRSVRPRPAAIAVSWNVDPATRDELEQRHHLRPLRKGPDEKGRWHYEVPNIYDVALWELRGAIENADSAQGFDWEQLERLRALRFVPTREASQLWFLQLALLLPILLAISAGVGWLRAVHVGRPVPVDCYLMLAAAAFLYAIERSLFRETSYVMTIIPLAAGLSARFLAWRGAGLWPVTRLGLAVALWLVTAVSAVVYASSSRLFDPIGRVRAVPSLFAELLTSPPIDAYQPAAAARMADQQMWNTGAVDKGRLLTRYLHECTRPEDRILVTGSTPYHITYYTNRRIAGGHVFWHHGWRSDPVREEQLLALLERQSVPFAFSTHDPVFADLQRYPRIHQHFATHYAELEGTNGLLLFDTRRGATSRFGRLGFPCFD